MPTSTPWHDRHHTEVRRSASPVRPSNDDIEPLSPGPFLPPSASRSHSSKHGTRESQLFGLGLSEPTSTEHSLSAIQPDHISIGQDGGAHLGSKVRSAPKRSQTSESRLRGARNGEARHSKANSRQNKGKAHTRSGSTIDDLANIAIATSPTFDNDNSELPFSHNSSRTGASRPSTSYIDGYDSMDPSHERPAKRIRSEKLHAMEWSPRDERPRTSHALQPYTSMEDAELLLGLRNGYSFSTNTSPVFAPATAVQPVPTSDLVKLPLFESLAALPEHNSNDNLDIDPTISNAVNRDTKQLTEKKGHNISLWGDDGASVENNLSKTESMQLDITKTQNQESNMPEPNTSVEKARPETVEKFEKTVAAQALPRVNKPRKIKPEVQAEVCAACNKLQRDVNEDDATTQWISCDYCKQWFHLACGGFKDKSETRAVDKYVCKDCEPEHGPTTFVRKSSRVRTAIDYAGLNQGLIKVAEESSTHHYIQPIKDGTIHYLQDNFARVRPELVTAEFWENMDNMKRPFVVPACWNPRFGTLDHPDLLEKDSLQAEPQIESSFACYDEKGNLVDQRSLHKADSHSQESKKEAEELVLDCDQDYLDMVMPRNLTVRKVAELYGPEQPVPVIDVKSQETKGQWTLSEWADYYEQKGEKPIRNVISLEVSNSPIGKLIRRPKAVRDIDLEDYVWDNETRSTSNKRPVQFYCLMSVADSYTDFHIDFGGSSVYYHILKGVKTFFFIPPEDKYLKEYEKWCNSDTQNDTWLGDMCNGNVTRVDLHEGDTAFIPAGWIHSVWTPEDSLVIGGNFLTKVDYELQLRVTGVEKATKVPQKFRYPFFQKVMWYALLKYLEEDPVPEEVLGEFHADEEYKYLRANPVWHEYGELASDAEPGQPGYNARIYPKSEINGLPHLRDYLYRTACIHADIPVPDINKKQIDAVKASIPKGHGDPMRLIKTFAVWCAWKAGNEPVPRWVHDQGNGLSSDIKDREKTKEEVFRVPPERVSARNASKAKLSTPPAEAVTTPAKAAASSADTAETSSVKSRSGSRGGSLRVACDICRRRRIKCRHKEGEEVTANSSPPEIRPRTYSNVSMEIPKLASASPVSSAFDQTSIMPPLVPDLNNTSDLAQAALASLHSQSSDPTQPAPLTPNGNSSKKGRSKACEECRKSKRRCVHDEYGRIDPAKAAEPSKPRGSANPKRQSRSSEDNASKQFKIDSDADFNNGDFSNLSDIDMMIDPALMAESFAMNSIHAPTESIVMHNDPENDMNTSIHDQEAPLSKTGINAVERDQMDTIEDFTSTGAVGSEIQAHPHTKVYDNIKIGVSNLPAYIRQSPDVDISYSPITVDCNLIENTEKSDVKMEDIDTVMVEPQLSLREGGMAAQLSSKDSVTISGNTQQRARYNHTSTSSENSPNTNEESRRSSSNTSGPTHQSANMNAKLQELQENSLRPVSRGSSADSELDADERFARELQAAENGLRRRASVKA